MSRTAVQKATLPGDALEQARIAFRNQVWSQAFSHFLTADREVGLGPDDLLLLSQTAQLLGKDAEGADFLVRAQQAFQHCGNAPGSARCAFWLGFLLTLKGEHAQASGWLSRANRLLENEPECVEHGYLLLPAAFRCFHSSEAVQAHALFVEAASFGERFGDRDLTTLALQGQGRSLIRQGETDRGLRLLDEAMLAVTTGEISPLTIGGVYCSVLDACGEIFDFERAQEWTLALERWCERQPDLVPYRGHCLVRRSELLQILGFWNDAFQWAQRATAALALPAPKRDLGAAYYQIGELHRLRGKFAKSEEAYAQASQYIRNPGPGLALLLLAQGKVEAAEGAIHRLLEEVEERSPRVRVLEAAVEIFVQAMKVPTARYAADELMKIAAVMNVPFVQAASAAALGSVLLAEGDAVGASAALRRACNLWCELQAPYEAARVRVVLALACRELGETESARHELIAAQETFQDLGSAVDAAHIGVLLPPTSKGAGPLTERELEVLRLVASGLSNRTTARQLHISEKTVARHLSNIFTKLDLSSRTAAAAYAYDHHLI